MWIQLFCLWDPNYNRYKCLIILICRKWHCNRNVIESAMCNIRTFAIFLSINLERLLRLKVISNFCFSHHKKWWSSIIISAAILGKILKKLKFSHVCRLLYECLCLCVRQEDKQGDEWRWAYFKLIGLNRLLTPVSICLQPSVSQMSH